MTASVMALVVCGRAAAGEPEASRAADSVGTQRVWQPQPAAEGARPEPLRARVVDFGDDYAWRFPDQYGWRGKSVLHKELDLDRDGEKDDCMHTIEFSLSRPFNPVFPWDPEGTNARFYGGLTGFFMDTQEGRFGEGGGPNVDHGTNDDLNFMSFYFEPGKRVSSKLPLGGYTYNYLSRLYGLWLWKKDDFRSGGDRWRVSFGKDSRISLFYHRYWTGLTEGRFVVQDGDQFYISEFSYKDFDDPTIKDKGGRNTPSVRPLETRWARYDAKPPHHIVFDRKKAEFKQHAFTDIRAAGYYVCKEPPDERATWLKLGPFEVEAVVHRPVRVSENLAMVKVAKAGTVPAFHVSKTEIPYTLWQKVYRWSVSHMYCHQPGYIMDRDGDMGSMDRGPSEHGPNEPVTEMSWLDAVAWCNALSEHEGKTPCYYVDPEFKTPFRKVRERQLTRELNAKYVPKVYPKWQANGYRLPTVGEWRAALANSPRTAEHAWTESNSNDTTHPVGTVKPNSAGVYDMIGNVWEYVWDAGDAHDPTADGFRPQHTVLGGGMHFPEDPTKRSASPYGDEPYATGSYKVGFRVVRREAGLPKPPSTNVVSESDIPTWTFAQGRKTAGTKPEQTEEPVLETVSVPEGVLKSGDETKTISPLAMSKCEISYAQWKRAYDWAVANGYSFNGDGDMGSMDWQTSQHSHGPDEPVTQIWYYDMIAWCNALSEMQGLAPCYYVDAAEQTVYRHAFPGRLPMKLEKRPEGFRTTDKFHLDPSADGYRLPTVAEWTYACRAGAKTQYYWSNEKDDRYVWCTENSNGKTHPVGTKLPNAFGLHDMAGNVFERLQAPGYRLPIYGGSFRYGQATNSSRYFRPSSARAQGTAWGAYPEVGFRVVRQPSGR